MEPAFPAAGPAAAAVAVVADAAVAADAMVVASARPAYFRYPALFPACSRCTEDAFPAYPEFPAGCRCTEDVSPVYPEFPACCRCMEDVSPAYPEFLDDFRCTADAFPGYPACFHSRAGFRCREGVSLDDSTAAAPDVVDAQAAAADSLAADSASCRRNQAGPSTQSVADDTRDSAVDILHAILPTGRGCNRRRGPSSIPIRPIPTAGCWRSALQCRCLRQS